MKKKFKLFATIGSLALAICMMTIGVLAATQVSLSVTSNVSFSTDKVYVDVTGEVAYSTNASTRAKKAFTGKNYSTLTAPAGNMILTAGEGTPTISGTEAQFGNISFYEKQNDTIVYTFTITNAGSNACFVKIDIPAYESEVTADNVTIETKCFKGVAPGTSMAYDGTASLAKGEKMTLTYTLTLTDVSHSVDGFDNVDFTFTMQSEPFSG